MDLHKILSLLYFEEKRKDYLRFSTKSLSNLSKKIIMWKFFKNLHIYPELNQRFSSQKKRIFRYFRDYMGSILSNYCELNSLSIDFQEYKYRN